MKRFIKFLCICIFLISTFQNCSSSTANGGESNAGSETSSDAGTTKDTHTHSEKSAVEQENASEQANGNTFSCGPKACQKGAEYCKPRGTGSCSGPAPGADGKCPKYCQKMDCGRTEGTCLCTTYSCQQYPAGCTDCECIKKKVPGGVGCICEKKDGGILLNCPAP